MKNMISVEDFLETVNSTLKATLEKDFGEEAHVVDLLSHTVTQLEGIFQWMYAYPQEVVKK